MSNVVSSRPLVRGFITLCGVLASTSCGGGFGPIKPPGTPTFVDDTDPERARVTMAKDVSKPLIVDWQPEYRSDLESTTKRGLAVVQFDQKTFKLLPRCHADATYTYVGVTPKEQQITMHSRAELYTNLPLGAVSLEGKLGQSGSLVVQLRIVGTSELNAPSITRAQLTGDCAGATHFVQSMTLGAFRFMASAAQNAGGGVKAFGAGAGAEAEGSTEMLQKDGDFTSCDSADPDAPAAPKLCRAVLRIQIVPIDAAPAQAASTTPTCGEGMRWDGQGACVTVRRVEAEAQQAQTQGDSAPASTSGPRGFQCAKDKPDECEAQCRLGNMASCNIYGWYLLKGGGGVTQDEKKAMQLWAVSCKAKYGEACTSLALYFEDKRMFREAAEVGTQGCLSGDPHVCTEVAVLAYFGRGVAENRPAAFKLFLRGCKLRDWNACSNAGTMILTGDGGAPKDPVSARKLFTMACQSPDHAGCGNLGDCYELGLGGPKDFAMAVKLNMQACDAGTAASCASAGLLIEENSTNPEHRKKALELYEKGCAMPAGGGCSTEAEMRQRYPGVYTDEGFNRRSCDDGDQRAIACYNAAIASERGYGGSVDLGKAKEYLDIACNKGGLKKACRAPQAH